MTPQGHRCVTKISRRGNGGGRPKEQAKQERADYPAGVPCFVDSGRKDSAVARAFYSGLFGWDFENLSPEGAPSCFVATLHGKTVAGIGEQPDMDWPPVWNSYLRIDDADAVAAKVAQAGGRMTMEPLTVGPAGRFAVFDDPEGAEFCVWEPDQLRRSQAVTNPGTWVFSGLNTDDREAAEAFNAAIFGWRSGPTDGDGNGMIMMAGYQEFLTRSDPELPARLEQLWAPEGLGEEVVLRPSTYRGPTPRPRRADDEGAVPPTTRAAVTRGRLRQQAEPDLVSDCRYGKGGRHRGLPLLRPPQSGRLITAGPVSLL